MALFGAPLSSEDDADKAVAVACEMIVSLQKLNEVRSLKDLEAIEIGIGVSTGDVVAGSVGSEKRMEYTVIGDSVNLAARLESANKFYGTNVLISEHTVRDLTRETPLREIDLIRVKGQDQPIAVYEALAHQLPETLVKIPPLKFTLERWPSTELAIGMGRNGLSRLSWRCVQVTVRREFTLKDARNTAPPPGRNLGWRLDDV